MTEDLLPPHNQDAEESVLGAVLIDGELIRTLNLEPEDFYPEQNLLVYKAMKSLQSNGTAINQITVAQYLTENNQVKDTGGAAYLSHCISVTPTTYDCQDYADIVKRLSTFRKLNNASKMIAKMALEGKGNINDVLSKADDAILKLRRDMGNNHIITPKDRADLLFTRYEALFQEEGGIALSTGLYDLDNRLGGGLFPGEFIIVGARPGMGKTTMLECISNHVAQTSNVLFCSGEMDVEGLSDRDIAGYTGIAVDTIRMGGFSDEDFQKIVNEAVPNVCSRKVYHLDAKHDFQLNTANIYQAAYELQTRESLSLIVIDYLGLLVDRYGNNNNDRLGYITRTIKQMAKTLKVPILCAHQLSRAVETRENKEPELHDLRDSGNIEQDADVVLFLYRDNYYNRQSTSNVTDILIAKKRQGRGLRKVMVLWNEAKQTYLNMRQEAVDATGIQLAGTA